VLHEAPPVSRHWLARVVDPSVMGVTAILTLVQVTQPVVSSFMPLYFKSIGVGGVELFFVGQGIMSIFSRALLGQWGDRLGRSRAQALGFSVQMVGLVLIWQSRHLALLTLGGALYTLGIGISQPSLYALAADRSHPSRRGAAMATFTMGFQLGSGLGAVIWGTTIEYFGYSVMFGLTLIPMLGAIVMSQIEGRRKAVRTY
jgi:MFS family permease